MQNTIHETRVTQVSKTHWGVETSFVNLTQWFSFSNLWFTTLMFPHWILNVFPCFDWFFRWPFKVFYVIWEVTKAWFVRYGFADSNGCLFNSIFRFFKPWGLLLCWCFRHLSVHPIGLLLNRWCWWILI